MSGSNLLVHEGAIEHYVVSVQKGKGSTPHVRVEAQLMLYPHRLQHCGIQNGQSFAVFRQQLVLQSKQFDGIPGEKKSQPAARS